MELVHLISFKKFVGRLFLISAFIHGVVSFQSLIVRDRCKLEVWDHADDLDLGVPADLVPLLHHIHPLLHVVPRQACLSHCNLDL